MKSLFLLIVLLSGSAYSEIRVITGHSRIVGDLSNDLLIDMSDVSAREIGQLFRSFESETNFNHSGIINQDELNQIINDSVTGESYGKRKILIDIDSIESIQLKKGYINKFEVDDF